MRHIPRIYVEGSIFHGAVIVLNKEQSFHLAKVMRVTTEHIIKVFNPEYGEWLAKVQEVKKSGVKVLVQDLIACYQKKRRSITLFFAPIKTFNPAFYIQKATELGVDSIQPVITSRTVVRSINIEKLKNVAIEAACQSGRISVPSVSEAIGLHKLPNNIPIVFCNEQEKDCTILDIISTITQSLGILIGPEGGFEEAERALLGSLQNVHSVSLGNTVLRAETAMIAALAISNMAT